MDSNGSKRSVRGFPIIHASVTMNLSQPECEYEYYTITDA